MYKDNINYNKSNYAIFWGKITKYEQDMYTKNSKTLLREIKEDLNNGQIHSAGEK